jgi:hypothetical protein
MVRSCCRKLWFWMVPECLDRYKFDYIDVAAPDCLQLDPVPLPLSVTYPFRSARVEFLVISLAAPNDIHDLLEQLLSIKVRRPDSNFG